MSQPQQPADPTKDAVVINYANGRPAGAPRRLRVEPMWPVVLAGATTALVALGGLVVFVPVMVSPTMGATRATRVRWQQASAEVEDAVAAEQQQHQGRQQPQDASDSDE